MSPLDETQPLRIELPGGQTLEITTGRQSTGKAVRVRPLGPIDPRFWEMCPICGEPATEDEHVPPASVGGAVMTRTCGPCNNRLGSNVEADLADWHLDALTRPGFSSDAAPGVRRSSRILRRATPNGQFVLVIDGGLDPVVRTMLDSGQVDLSALVPNLNRSRIGLLKQAFLAACLRYGLLEGEVPDAVRRDLIAARDAKGRQSVPTSELALGLAVFRSNERFTALSPLVHAIAESDDDQWEGVVLAGTTFVSWSSEAEQVGEGIERLDLSLEVGDRIDGVVAEGAADDT